MTKNQIENTIKMTKAAIAAKTGKRTQFSPTLKRDVLAAAEVVGAAEFAKESGLSAGLISRWSRTLSIARESLPENNIVSSGLMARELLITKGSSSFVEEVNTLRRAVIRTGNKLEIEVPLDFLTPAWILEVAGLLNSGKEATRV